MLHFDVSCGTFLTVLILLC